ncbi:acyltransferase family protein [Thiocapsa roseopersicina]|uniref:Peptidoglycan/LPS O-acetylase OafA/YrhL, contains acyltransferase and SGNH-hydrolase domains n=1 Tax=Thiocapsa roseopersicina TaxID=1058 RepID=A0A1H2T307_THIRO|nr:acyltransferase [Thiocapsa roseopersicina]SDW38095.1 Peptidoglycan/LPS O-acetylase OafA/YrhL, contains acyltransferase and SGNH-hydrolase domains [Thiocapsa roseopersicina]
MNPTSTERNGALDGIRGLAILWVFAFHANALLVGWPSDASPGWGQSLAEKGLLGVQLFFVLSGFLLAQPWMQAAEAGTPYPRVGRFFARRARRIVPTYWVHLVLLFGLILPILHGGYAILRTDVGQANLWLHIPLLHFLHPGSSSSLGLNMALWSLSIEAQFYLLLPLLAPLFVRNRVLIALPTALLVALLWKTYAPGMLMEWVYLNVSPSRLVFFDPVSGRAGPFPPEMMRFFLERQLPGEIIAFALGMAAANLDTRLRSVEPVRQPLRAIDMAALAFLVLATPMLIHLSLGEILTGVGWRLVGMPLFLVGCTLLVLAAALRTPLIDRIFAGPVLVSIGIISYSLFLWHEPVLRLVATGRLIPNACDGAPCRIALALGLALLVAAASYILTERRRSPRI